MRRVAAATYFEIHTNSIFVIMPIAGRTVDLTWTYAVSTVISVLLYFVWNTGRNPQQLAMPLNPGPWIKNGCGV